MDEVTLDVWRVTQTKDAAGSLVGTATRVHQGARGVVAPLTSAQQYFGEGVVLRGDAAVLFEACGTNTSLWAIFKSSPHQLWILVTDSRSYFYQQALHVESVEASALSILSADFAAVVMVRKSDPKDAVSVDTVNMVLETR